MERLIEFYSDMHNHPSKEHCFNVRRLGEIFTRSCRNLSPFAATFRFMVQLMQRCRSIVVTCVLVSSFFLQFLHPPALTDACLGNVTFNLIIIRQSDIIFGPWRIIVVYCGNVIGLPFMFMDGRHAYNRKLQCWLTKRDCKSNVCIDDPLFERFV